MAVDRWILENKHLDQATLVQRPETRVPMAQSWLPPPVGMLKLNIDATFSYGSSNSFAVVVRDFRGLIVHVETGLTGAVEDALHAEAVAAWRAISWARSMQLSSVILESDCQVLINDLSMKSDSLTSAGLLLDAIKSISVCFSSCSFSFVKRGGNKVADAMAKFQATSLAPFQCFTFSELPADVAVLVQSDVMVE
ncbi:uncharacterized protein [Rutidosis leptorrhynchoides]|uniref:uncharacterized protein n=1 Tax=Rutidosis leptorrhynchoides TaxID=125765 RepID=UPI003A99A547